MARTKREVKEIKAEKTTNPFEATPSGVEEMAEIRALMNQAGLNFIEAKILRGLLLEEGKSVEDFTSDATLSQPHLGPIAIFRKAGELIALSGTVQRANEAVSMYAKMANIE